MTDIKFRTWDHENECFTHFTFSDIDRKGGIKTKYGWSSIEAIIEQGIQRFAGLVDKNGIDIYEGDFIKAVTAEEFFKWPAKGYVEFINSSFAVNCGKGHPDSDKDYYFWFDLNTHNDIEVIGNIYKNRPDQPNELNRFLT